MAYCRVYCIVTVEHIAFLSDTFQSLLVLLRIGLNSGGLPKMASCTRLASNKHVKMYVTVILVLDKQLYGKYN